jgi:peptidoglycan/xylan/chitin deacetylase (PgdA/CDA1 family)
MKHLINRIVKKAKREFIYALQNSKNLFGLNANFFKNARGCRIIVYHGICLKDHTRFNGIFLKKVAFEKHLLFYKKYFNIISLDDYFAGNFNESRFNVCITFDDGYCNNFKYVLPLMEQYKVPMTFFITAIREAGYDILWNDFLGIVTKYGPQKLQFRNIDFEKKNSNYVSLHDRSTLRMLLQKSGFEIKQEMMQYFADKVLFRDKKADQDFWQQMSTIEIQQLAASKFATVGAHGYYHNDLSEVSIDHCKKEMIQCKLFLESITNKSVDAIAFPYGNYSKQVITEAKKIGYKQLLALDYKYDKDATDDLMKSRFIINPYISVVNQMYAIVKGKYE